MWPRRGRISILGIVPNELLLLIINNLEMVDQTCLALSCWTLYHKIGPLVLDHPDLSLSLTADICPCTSPRSELLRRLEKDHYKRWIHCTTCYTLHPPSEFIGVYNFLGYWPCSFFSRHCQSSGVVDLCPCIQLTFRQKVRLIRYLKALSQNTDHENASQNPIMHGRLRAFKVDMGNKGGPKGTRYLSHECSISNNPLGIIKIKMNAYLSNEDHFVVETKYEVSGSSPVSQTKIRKSEYCLHINAYGHDTSCLGWILWDRQYSYSSSRPTCFFCTLPYRRRPLGPFQETGQCIRDLGSSTWPPDHTWDVQCISPWRTCYYTAASRISVPCFDSPTNRDITRLL
jgi:hypothetical protein